MSQPQFDQVTVLKKANVYFDGKCISHTVQFPDGTRKTLGVILPSVLVFKTGVPERMEIVSGECKVKIAGNADAETYRAGQFFFVPGDSEFEISVEDGALDYVCHFEG